MNGGIMMRKFFVIFTPIAIIAISMAIALSGTFLKKPRGEWDNVPKHMETTTKAIMSDDWTLAEQNETKLETAWKTVIKRIQFSGERDEMHDLTVSIFRLRASITSKDKSSALMELSEAKEHWDGLCK
jgi:hypothetical protein